MLLHERFGLGNNTGSRCGRHDIQATTQTISGFYLASLADRAVMCATLLYTEDRTIAPSPREAQRLDYQHASALLSSSTAALLAGPLIVDMGAWRSGIQTCETWGGLGTATANAASSEGGSLCGFGRPLPC